VVRQQHAADQRGQCGEHRYGPIVLTQVVRLGVLDQFTEQQHAVSPGGEPGPPRLSSEGLVEGGVGTGGGRVGHRPVQAVDVESLGDVSRVLWPRPQHVFPAMRHWALAISVVYGEVAG
jgi:hypothetical protein